MGGADQPALARFMDMSGEASARRKARLRQRRRRDVGGKRKHNRISKKKKASGASQPAKGKKRLQSNTRKRLPCCALERRKCCCGDDVDHMLSEKALHALVRDIKARDLLTRLDPKDMAYILTKLHGRRMSIHCFWFHCALFRIYSKPKTYEELSKHAGALQSGGRGPDWTGMQLTLERLYSEGTVWGGMFYPATLRKGKRKGKRWHVFTKVSTPAQKASRDVMAFQILWEGITAGAAQPGEALSEYFACRQKLSDDHTLEAYQQARKAFAAFFDSFHAYMHNHTRGFWGDYTFKILLDVACNISLPSIKDKCAVCPDGVLSRWPIECPAYAPAIKRVLKPTYKNLMLSKYLKHHLLMRIHFILSARLGAKHHNLPSTMAQLCWQKRDSV